MFRFVFSLFLFLYFATAQSDVISYMWSQMLKRPTEPYPMLSALGLTLALVLILKFAEKHLCRSGVSTFPAYVGVAWFVTAFVSAPFASWLWQSLLFIVAVAIAFWGYWWANRLNKLWGTKRNLWQNYFPPVLELLVLGLYMGFGAAAKDYEHFELQTAEYLRTNRPQQAYKVGEVSLSSSPRLFAMRCYLMAITQAQELPQNLYKQPVPLKNGSANLLFPDDEKQSLILPKDSLERLLGCSMKKGETAIEYFSRCAYTEKAKTLSKGIHSRIAADYYLCGLLLDRNLDRFAHEINNFYANEIAKGKLPHYFAQALVYYCRSRMNPVIFYHDTAVETNLRDYTDLEKSLTDPRMRYNMLRRSYGETLWWWYDYAH